MKYRKKPVVIDAIQYCFDEVNKCKEEIQDDIADFMNKNITIIDDKIEIDTLEGPIHASINDYIIKGVQGEFYPCKPDIFEQTYEKVKE